MPQSITDGRISLPDDFQSIYYRFARFVDDIIELEMKCGDENELPEDYFLSPDFTQDIRSVFSTIRDYPLRRYYSVRILRAFQNCEAVPEGRMMNLYFHLTPLLVDIEHLLDSNDYFKFFKFFRIVGILSKMFSLINRRDCILMVKCITWEYAYNHYPEGGIFHAMDEFASEF